jgi:hypothetical protein
MGDIQSGLRLALRRLRARRIGRMMWGPRGRIPVVLLAVVLAFAAELAGCASSGQVSSASSSSDASAVGGGASSTSETVVPPPPPPPPAGFCDSHSCIPSFDAGVGYIVECADGMWSHSGGRPGACSDHGGETSNTAPDQSGGSGGSVPPQTSSSPDTSGMTQCDPNIYAGANTSCPFAENVFRAVAASYQQNGGQIPSSVTATSPTTGQTYGLSCSVDGSQNVQCSTTSGATVTFSVHSVQVY